MEDKRNVIDKYKGIAVDEIVKDLDAHGTGLEIAIENLGVKCPYCGRACGVNCDCKS